MTSSGLPRVKYDANDAQVTRSAQSDSTTAFVAVEAPFGPLGPIDLYSSRDTDRKVGTRSGPFIEAWDCIDVLLREQVTHVVFSRLVGPTPVAAKVQVPGAGGSGYSLGFTVGEYGDVYNGASASGHGVSVGVTAADGTHRNVTVFEDGVAIASSGSLTTRAAIAAALANLTLSTGAAITVDLGSDVTLPAATAPLAATGGTDDASNATTTEVRAAMDRIGKGKGPGQLYTPGRDATTTLQTALEHCAAQNRTYIGQLHAGLSIASLKAVAATLRALGTGADGIPRLGGLWFQNYTIDAPIPGGKRTVPWAWIMGGLIARAERQAGHPNVDAMGVNGRPLTQGVIDRYVTDDEADDLVDAGVNVVVDYLGAPRAESFVSIDNPATSEWVDLAHTRFERVLQAKADGIGREVQGLALDGQGLAAQRFGGKLRDMLGAYWPDAVYGETAEESFLVDTGPTQNSDETAAAREVHASMGVKMSPHAWFVFITNAKVPITQPLAA